MSEYRGPCGKTPNSFRRFCGIRGGQVFTDHPLPNEMGGSRMLPAE